MMDESDNVPQDISARIDKKLRGEEVQLPEEIAAAAERMRQHIDTLSIKLMSTGNIQGQLKQSFLENIGSYIHRSYRLYDQDVEWGKEQIPEDVWNAAVVHMRNVARKELRAKKEENAQRDLFEESPDQTLDISESELNQRAEEMVYDIISSKDQNGLMKYFEDKQWTEDKGDRDILKKKQDIPRPIRDLMGEYKRSDVNYVKTIEGMSNLIFKRQFFDNISDQHEGVFFFNSNQEILQAGEDPQDYRTGLPTGVGSKLENKLMHKDLFEALQTKEVDNPGWLTTFYRANAAAKYSKTVLSHVAHVRNVMGGFGFLGWNGHMFNTAERQDVWKKTTSVFRSYEGLTKKELEDVFLKYQELGLIGGSVRAGEMQDILRDTNWDSENFMENFNHLNSQNKKGSPYKRTKSWFKK
jgi:hypothetical protein